MRKPAYCICENKGADQLCGNPTYRTADQHLCSRYIRSKIPLFPKYEISSPQPSSVAVQPVCDGNPKDRFSHEMAHI